jgi:TIR domain
MVGGGVHYQDMSQWGRESKDILSTVVFNHIEFKSEKSAVKKFAELIDRAGITWLYFKDEGWIFDADLVANQFNEFQFDIWFKGKIRPEVDVEQFDDEFAGRERRSARLIVLLRQEDFKVRRSKIFLSHKSADKTYVRRVSEALRLVGYKTWLDEDAMPAGSKLHRSINSGFEESFAAVFFVSKNFSDERYLADEIDMANSQRMKFELFKIIPIMLVQNKQLPKMPSSFDTLVWKEARSDLDAFTEIVRAIPSDYRPHRI